MMLRNMLKRRHVRLDHLRASQRRRRGPLCRLYDSAALSTLAAHVGGAMRESARGVAMDSFVGSAGPVRRNGDAGGRDGRRLGGQRNCVDQTIGRAPAQPNLGRSNRPGGQSRSSLSCRPETEGKNFFSRASSSHLGSKDWDQAARQFGTQSRQWPNACGPQDESDGRRAGASARTWQNTRLERIRLSAVSFGRGKGASLGTCQQSDESRVGEATC